MRDDRESRRDLNNDYVLNLALVHLFEITSEVASVLQ